MNITPNITWNSVLSPNAFLEVKYSGGGNINKTIINKCDIDTRFEISIASDIYYIVKYIYRINIAALNDDNGIIKTDGCFYVLRTGYKIGSNFYKSACQQSRADTCEAAAP